MISGRVSVFIKYQLIDCSIVKDGISCSNFLQDLIQFVGFLMFKVCRKICLEQCVYIEVYYCAVFVHTIERLKSVWLVLLN